MVFKTSNIGTVIVASLANLFRTIGFKGLALIIFLFIVSVISTLVLPTTTLKWNILAPIVIPVFMNAGLTPEFAQIIFRFGECVTMGLTPIMAYFVIYLAILNKNCKEDDSISIKDAIRFQLPYIAITFVILLAIIILWYIIGLPLGINGKTVL